MFDPKLQEHFKVDFSIYNSRVLPQEWLEEIYKLKLFKLFVPKDLGGLELDLVSGLKVLMDTASINGSLGWVINLGAGAGYFSGLFDERTSEEIFNDEKAVVAGSGKVGGKARKDNEHYLINGTWEYCTGAAHAKYFTANAFFDDGTIKSVLFFRDQVKIHDDWKLFALKATSTFSFETENTLVEKRFIFSYDEQKSFFDYPLCRIPFWSFAKFCMISSLIGMAECFINNVQNEFDLENDEKNYSNEFLSKLNSEKLNLLNIADQFYEKAGDHVKILAIDQNKLSSSISKLREMIYNMTCHLFLKLGISITDETFHSHHAWRDVILIAKHFVLR